MPRQSHEARSLGYHFSVDPRGNRTRDCLLARVPPYPLEWKPTVLVQTMNQKALNAMYELLEAARKVCDQHDPETHVPHIEELTAAVEEIDNLVGSLRQLPL